MILHIAGILAPDEVQHVREVLAAAQWADGKATAGHRAAAVKDNLQLPPGSPDATRLADYVAARLARHPVFVAATLPLRILPPRFNRYEGGGAYGLHIDNAIFPAADGGASVRSDISTTVFLSDPDSYDGGELIVEGAGGGQSIKLPAGDAIIYPARSLHRVAPVTRGTRHAAFLWTQSLVRSDQQRQMLYELDLTIQELAVDHPEHGAIENLTNLYHNLLREWAET